LGGYSTIWMARALPAGGRIVTIECAPHHAEVARGNLRRAGVEARVDLRVGPALDMLPVIAAEGLGPFDLVFIDADKPNNPAYLDWALRLVRRGGVILVDNVVRGGRVVEAESGDANVAGTRRMVEMLRGTEGVGATAIQTVGAKGWDGFVIAVAG
ncbi:MAG: O-methyltransferase, partial [Thermoleophilia bacterium]|nr:O-methyltransferase [Thermoleophilia bacterium]